MTLGRAITAVLTAVIVAATVLILVEQHLVATVWYGGDAGGDDQVALRAALGST
jgi:hypothetical protein